MPSLLLSGGLSPPSTPINPTMEATTTKVTIDTLAQARPVGPTSPAITRAGAGLVAGRLDLVGAVAGRHQSPKPDAPLLLLVVLHQTHSSCTPLPILTTPPSALHIFFA